MGAWIETGTVAYAVPAEAVAPYMGAWIETGIARTWRGVPWSLPTWGRGLKLAGVHTTYIYHRVAPYMGAWIETDHHLKTSLLTYVAPYMGAWIETPQR